MNFSSSSSNSNNGFSGFNEMNPVLGFNSPALTGSGKNLARPRLMKARKQTNSYKSNSNSNDYQVIGADQGLGFSQFRGSESVLGNLGFGNVGNSFGSDVIVEDMSKLKIDDDDKRYDNVMKKKGVFGVDSLMDDELLEEISKMTIEGERNVKNDNLQDFGKSDDNNNNNNNVAVEIENEMKNMNLKDHKEGTLFGSASFTSRSDKMAEFAFTSKLDDLGAPFVEFKTPDMKGNMFSGFNRFEARKESVKDTRVKKKKGKLKTHVVGSSRVREGFGFSRRSLSGNSDTFEAYSPMDISLCDEKLANNNYSRETSVTSDDASQNSDQIGGTSEPLVVTSNVTTDDESVELYVNEVSETESFKSATENLGYSSDTFVTALDSDVTSTETSGRQESVFSFASKAENVSEGNFTFAASSSSQSHLPSDIRHKKKLPLKIVRDSYSSMSAELFPFSGSSSILSPGNGLNVDLSTLHKKKDNIIPVSEQDFRHENVIAMSSSKLAEEACEKWRLRGNQAYSNGDLAKADDCYTQGINSVPQNEKSRNCLRALMLCYSNRAAARISLGRMKEALNDCLMADTIDPNFLKVQVRAAHCYLAMGETENAKKQYMKCLQSRTNSSVDNKVIAEASEGLEKTQKVLECIKQCTDLSQRRASEDFECALRVINEALQISTCSEKLLQMKAEALFMLQRYEQVIQVCEPTLASDEVNTSTNSWKPHLIVKAYFYLGRLDDALEYINKHENSCFNAEREGNTSQESAIPLADTIRELLSHKTAGNEAYKSGKHAEAVEHYTTALSCNVESRPFASVCFCNRAAAYRCLSQITDAIADCSLAIALDPNYLKAISRRASLYEMIRDHGQAAKDLQRVVSLLTTQVKEKGDLSGASEKLSLVNELKQARLQLANAEEQSRKGIPLNMYIILGVESTASAPDIKKAYRKAALKHHPDKVAQSLVRSDDGDDGLWKEIAENVQKDAERLFKMIGEAYAVLSNPSKRSRYDEDKEMRNEASRFTRSNSSRMATDVQNSVFERSETRQWQDSHRHSKYY